MPAVQTTYAQYQGQWSGEGFEPHMAGYNNITGIVETPAGIPFGRAVSQGTLDKQVILGGTKFRGISVMDSFRVPTIANPVMDFYAFRENIGVKTLGPIVVKNMSGAAVAADDPVFWDPTTGYFSNSEGATAVGAPSFTGTGNGTLTKATPAAAAASDAGTYAVRFVTATHYIVLDPAGDQVGEGDTAVAFTGPVLFTVAAGGTPFVVGDTFLLAVSVASQGPIPGARWETSAADAALAIVHLGIQK